VKEERKKKLNTARATLHDRREMRAFLKQTPFRGTDDKRTPIPSRGRIFVFFSFVAFGFSRQKPCTWRPRD
jgi:hypothetical protein